MTENPEYLSPEATETAPTATVVDLTPRLPVQPLDLTTKPEDIEDRMRVAAEEASTLPPVRTLTVQGPALWEAPEPALPAWIWNRDMVIGWAVAKRRQAWWLAKRHLIARAPQYLGYGLRRTGRGVRRASAGAYGYLMATDYAAMIKAAKVDRRHDLVIALREQRRKTIEQRMKSKRTIAVGAGVATLLLVAAAYGLLVLTLGAATTAAFAAGGADPKAKDEEGVPVIGASVPTDGVLNDAFRRAGLLAKPNKDGEGGQALRFVSPIVDDRGVAWTVVADLPGGKASQVVAKREELAAALGVDEMQLHVERVRATDGGHASRFSLWVAYTDPFGGNPVRTPLFKRDSFDIWTEEIPVGLDARGRVVSVPMMWAALLVGAIPRQGKTFFLRLFALACALDPHVRHLVANGKGDRSWKPFKKIAHCYINGAGPEECKQLRDALRDVQRDMNRRNALLDGLSDEECPEDKLTPELARKHKMPPTVIEIDELQRYLDGDLAEEILDLLVDIAKVGPSTGYILMLATQRPDAKCVPPELRDVIAYRGALKVMDWRSSEVILGAGTYGKGYDASAEEIGARKGMAILLREDGIGRTLRGFLAEAYEAGTICERGRQLRVKAGTLTGDAAGEASRMATADPTAKVVEIPAWLAAASVVLSMSEHGALTPAALVDAILTAHPEWEKGERPLTARTFGMAMTSWGCGRAKKNGAKAPMYWAEDVTAAADRIRTGGPIEVNGA